MTDSDFQRRVLDDLGTLKVVVARLDERQQRVLERLDTIEGWQAEHDTSATETGKHELTTLRAELGSRRREWVAWTGKAALMVLGAGLATLAPACQHLVGF